MLHVYLCLGLEALITLLKTQDIDGGKYASFALSNLAVSPEYRQLIVEKGAIECLIYLACCDDILAQKQAFVALRVICISEECIKLVVTEGILDPFILLSRSSSDVELLREIATFYNVLSSVYENKREIAYRSLVSILPLTLHSDKEVEQQSISAVANLMEIMV
jgi:hypothetical protein